VSTPDQQPEEVMSPDGAPSPPPEGAASPPPEAVIETEPDVQEDVPVVEPEVGADGDPEAAAELREAAAEPEGDEAQTEPDPEAELREQAGRYLELAQRTQADFDNYRKRMVREVRSAEARGIGRLARELLPALDNLERALAAAESQPDGSEHHLAEGIRLVQAELVAAMGRVGVVGYSPKGEVFDPNVHEAMAQQPVEGTESGTIVEVFQSGYRIGEAVIRPARVVVAA
jgi:molecular chaperone GrpE